MLGSCEAVSKCLETCRDLLEAYMFAGDTTLASKMAAQMKKLQEILEPNFELLPKLVSSSALTHDENEDVEAERTTSRKIKALLEIIFENGKQEELMTALRDSDQIHVVNWIEGNGGNG